MGDTCKIVKYKEPGINNNIDIAARFKEFRQSFNLSTHAFAKSLNVSPTAISGIEHCRRTPSKNILIALVDIYDCDLTWLITGKSSIKTLAIQDMIQNRRIEMLTKRCMAKEQEILDKTLEISRLEEEIKRLKTP
ncbi:MAG: helix-turn-helix transcriptional regulator [Candidatus Margulisbacteria bacterium]|nr:helix-turn-helix transcriptional regulator [Candidatus Margulisiibacteriota bacterium]